MTHAMSTPKNSDLTAVQADSKENHAFTILLWDSLEAEYPSQWSKAMGDSPFETIEGKRRLTTKGYKWSMVALKATSSDGKLSRGILSMAIEKLRDRENASYPPNLAEFQKMVLVCQKIFVDREREDADRRNRSGQMLIGDIPMTQEQVNEKKHREYCNRLMLGYITNRCFSRYRKREALRNYLKADPERNQWHGYIRALAKQRGG